MFSAQVVEEVIKFQRLKLESQAELWGGLISNLTCLAKPGKKKSIWCRTVITVTPKTVQGCTAVQSSITWSSLKAVVNVRYCGVKIYMANRLVHSLKCI